MGKARDLANLLINGLIGPSKLSAGAPTWNAAGSVGIKATPNASWASDYAVLQINSTGSINGNTVAIVMANNTYYDGTNTRYLTAGPASDYFQYNGTHTWRYAAPGAAGAVATMVAGMTQDASGKLSVAGVIESTAGGVKFPDATVQMTAQNGIGFKNRIINGDMRIDQRNNGASVTANSASSVFAVDRFNTNVGSVAMAFSCQQIADAPAGFTNSLKITVTTPGTPTAGQFTFSRQVIEGNNIADLAWGTSSAVPVTVSAWVKASITGTYSAFLINHAEDRSYVGTFTVNTANTWEQKSFTVPGDTAGTWLTNNSNGIRFGFDLGSGSNFQGTANAWNTGWKQRTSGTVSFCQTSGATFQYTGVQLEAGTVATPFERRDYGRELMMCQRYYQKTYQQSAAPGSTSTLQQGAVWSSNPVTNSYPNIGTWNFAVPMRATPTVVGYNPNTGAGGEFRGDSVNFGPLATAAIGERSVSFFGSNVSVGTSVFISCHGTASAEL